MSEVELKIEIENRFGENLIYFLQDYSCGEERYVDSAEHEVYGEDESGRDVSCTISTLELAGEAANVLEYLLKERNQLRQQLAAAQAEVKRLESAWHAGELNRKDEIISRQEAENDRLKAIIKKAQEQKPFTYCFTDVNGRAKELCDSPDTMHSQDLRLVTNLYALPPIPAEQVEANNPAIAAIKYALDNINEDPINFLLAWQEGDFDCIRRDWDGVPDDVFIGADTLFKSEVKPS